MTILNIGPLNNSAPNASLIAATAFYLVGAITGLFGRFYREALAKSTVDDFGFSTVRFIATPLLSGLAGVGGVLLTVTLTALAGSGLNSLNNPQDLGQIFKVVPQFLLLAAIFGLTPNLLITGLQNAAKKYESDIQSSKIVESGPANNKA
jgi:H+/Cl- antiporter ClcA